MPNEIGANDFTLEELDALLSGEDDEQETPPVNEAEKSSEQPTEDDSKKESDVTQTKAFAKRLKESTDKARLETKDEVAKELGYESYNDMIAKRQKQMLEEKGYSSEELGPIVDELVKQRLEGDPRMKELEEYRKQQIVEYGKKELEEISKLTGGKITQFKQLPKDVLDKWRETGSLKSAYLELRGEELILEARRAQTQPTAGHMNLPEGNPPTPSNKRHLTDEERKVWKVFNPKMTDKELDEKLVDKN